MNNMHIAFLKELQSQLKWEREVATSYDPRPKFWVIVDYEYVLANETYDKGEMIKQHDSKLFYSFAELKTYLEERFSEAIVDDKRLSDLIYENEDIDELWEYLLENHNDGYFTEVYMKKTTFVVPELLFFTKNEASNYLEHNRSVYSKLAYIEQINVSGSSQVKQLFDTLLTFDFNVLKEN